MLVKMAENDVKKLQASGFYREISLVSGPDAEVNSDK